MVGMEECAVSGRYGFVSIICHFKKRRVKLHRQGCPGYPGQDTGSGYQVSAESTSMDISALTGAQ